MTVRPTPRRGVYERPFWEYVDQQQLHLQYCPVCDQCWYPPGPGCPRCLSPDWTWQPVSGRGSLISWATFHRQYFDSLPPPYTVVAGALEEGPILITDIAGGPDGLSLGMPLRLTYRGAQSATDEAFTLYHWGIG